MPQRSSTALRRLRRSAAGLALAAVPVVLGAPAAVAAVPATAPAPAAPVVDDVRADSSDPTAVVAGGVVVLVAGFTTLIAVRPPRRPPVDRT